MAYNNMGVAQINTDNMKNNTSPRGTLGDINTPLYYMKYLYSDNYSATTYRLVSYR